MRDDSAKWAPAQGQEREPVSANGSRLALIQPDRQTLISGPFGQALTLVGLDSAVSWPTPASSDTYACRLRRDRILVINGPDLPDGWNDELGLAVSTMTDGYAVLELEGPNAMTVLRRGTEISIQEPSASVARRFFGYPVLIYGFKTDERFRIHVPRAFLDGLWALFTGFMQQDNA